MKQDHDQDNVAAASNAAHRAPQVSVLVVTYNHADYVEEALDSLSRQTFRDFEIIIIDDASTDGCADVIAGWLQRTGTPAQFIRNQTNRGLCASLNAVLARASGDFVCLLPGDDAYEPDRIARQLTCFLKQPARVAAVYSDMTLVDAQGRATHRSFLDYMLNGAAPPQGALFARILAGNFLPGPAVMLRRSAIAEVGGYDESLFYEDFDMWLRLSSRFDFTYLPGRLMRYRTLDNSMSRSRANQPRIDQTRTRILKKWLHAGLDAATRATVLDALMHNGVRQLDHRDQAGARDTFASVIAEDPRLHRRILARAALLPGATATLRAWLPLYRAVTRVTRVTRRLARAGRIRRAD